jgi:hypothetical protein
LQFFNLCPHFGRNIIKGMVFVLLALFIRRFDGDGSLDMNNRSGRLACGPKHGITA